MTALELIALGLASGLLCAALICWRRRYTQGPEYRWPEIKHRKDLP